MDRHDKARAKNTGILGLGGSPVPKGPEDPSAANDADSKHQRRRRIFDDEAGVGQTTEEHSGATGIDMGSGGHGTDVSGR